MKTVEDHLRETLVGEVETITATELKKHMGECLTLASLGKSFCIKRKGKIVAYLTLDADIRHVVKSDGTCETREVVC